MQQLYPTSSAGDAFFPPLHTPLPGNGYYGDRGGNSAMFPPFPPLHPILPGNIYYGDNGGNGGMFPPFAATGDGYTALLFAEEKQQKHQSNEQLLPPPLDKQPPVLLLEEQQHLQTQDNDGLTLLYHGQVYVFDSVQAQKVQAILLSLSGQEPAPGTGNAGVESHSQVCMVPHTVVQPVNFYRKAALMRYKEKRKNLKFEKKVTYPIRSEVAFRMKRKRGRFATSAENTDMSLSATLDCKDDNTEQNSCLNCGKSRDATPMMRRAPDGAKTFCNACGLMWATKSKIRTPKNSKAGERDAASRPASLNQQAVR